MKRIKLLPENLINQIAAGEVIERPASVVKELVENSIDAGSAKIEIEISNECRNIRVADNGSGIHKEDAVLAFSRHATSKLQEEKDLWNISTLGFRGEALASIISIAKVSCTTRTQDSNSGIKIDCANSEVAISEKGCATGTIMEVKELFHNVPAREKFLKKSQTEFSNIAEVVQNIAVSNHNIAFELIHKGNRVLKTSGSSDLSVVLSEVYSKELLKELVEVYKYDSDPEMEVKGYVSSPDFTRSTRKAVYLYVNGRSVKCPILSKAIDTAYKDLIPSGRYPFAVINLKLPYDALDVNVHPAKREVRYLNPNPVFNFVLSSVKSALEFTSAVEQKEISREYSYSQPSYTAYKAPVYTNTGYSRPYEIREKTDFSYNTAQKSLEFFAPEPMPLFNEEKNIVATEQRQKIIGQFKNTYIIAEIQEGLLMVDQHIAHERVIYERLKTSDNYASQMLLTSNPVELEPVQISILEENRDLLNKYGYDFELNNRSVMLTRLPQTASKSSPEEIVKELLESLDGSLDEIKNKILITTACHSAVKAGEKLSIWQMEELINDLLRCSFSKTCPHGRAISHVIPTKEIAAFFGRFEAE